MKSRLRGKTLHRKASKESLTPRCGPLLPQGLANKAPRGVQRFPADAGPEIEVVSGGSALETLKGILGQIGPKHPAIRFGAMQGTGATYLLTGNRSRLKADEF